ncbi:acyclic terpene utilization AtuA family protein [Zwartia vadi]|uniref:acyclic terpene utilization AtuA family protein n=1 Tax=Zwartia vadi TaxID=3058168 RepID=UPI0025B6267B|nr:acyclic terpene utilization AtuA family protein [Zwartia vadi]MDN3986750.1 acyclic terpene utilization AtuA family protein [Zwartia vadi]
MSAVQALLKRKPSTLRVLSASGQLGYGIPSKALAAGLARQPDFIGCDMGSVDPGPAYLGSGEMATSPAITRSDLEAVLVAARRLDVPLIIGTAGTAGAGPHLDATLAIIRSIAAEHKLHFRLASIRADLKPHRVIEALDSGVLKALGGDLPVTAADLMASSNIVGQMGCAPFEQALALDPDVIIAGRACDTAVFASIPKLLGFSMANVMHMAKIIECTSICCEPGGRDAILATIDAQGFELESMNPDRRATPLSVAAHSLYEQSDPISFTEPDGTLRVDQAVYRAIDDRRTHVSGATWQDAKQTTIKVEASQLVGYRAVLLAGTADPNVIAQLPELMKIVEATTRGLVSGAYEIYPRLYGIDGVYPQLTSHSTSPREVFILVEVIAQSPELAMAAAKTFKQFLLHQGFSGRKCTGGNLAFPFTPPELAAGPAYRFSAYHVMPAPDHHTLFPVSIETI